MEDKTDVGYIVKIGDKYFNSFIEYVEDPFEALFFETFSSAEKTANDLRGEVIKVMRSIVKIN